MLQALHLELIRLQGWRTLNEALVQSTNRDVYQ
jgi:hypothetical protein